MKLHLALALFTCLVISCKKKEPAASSTPATSETAPTQAPPPVSPAPDPTQVTLLYHITDAKMRERLGLPSADADPFTGPIVKYPSQQLAEAGLPLPEGAVIARPNDSFVLKAPPAYHEKVAALLGVKGIAPNRNPKRADGGGPTDEVVEDPAKPR